MIQSQCINAALPPPIYATNRADYDRFMLEWTRMVLADLVEQNPEDLREIIATRFPMWTFEERESFQKRTVEFLKGNDVV